MGFDPSKAGLNNTKLIVQRAFNKNAQRQKSNYEQRSARVVYPYEISPNDLTNNGYILAVIDNLFNDNETRHLKIMIDDETYQNQKLYDQKKAAAKDNGNFNGVYIDSRMAEKLKFQQENITKRNQKIGLDQAIFQTGKVEKINGIEFIPVTVRRIVNSRYLDKMEYGPITATSYVDTETKINKIGALDLWETRPVAFDDEDSLLKIKEYLAMISDEAARYQNGEKNVNMNPRAGFKFIASKVFYTTDPATQEKVVEKRVLFDSTDSYSAVKDQETEKTRPLRYEELEAIMQGYKTYVFEGFGEDDPSLIDVLNKGDIDTHYVERENGSETIQQLGKIEKEDVLIELVTFKTYLPAPMQMNSFSFDVNKEKIEYSPLFRMTKRPYYNSLTSVEPKEGRNFAVLGFIKISKDKIDMDTMTKSVQSLVTSAHFGSFGGNVLTFLRNAEDGKKYFIVEKIRAMVLSEEDKKRLEQRSEEKKLKEGKTDTLSSASSGLSAPSNLSLQNAEEAKGSITEEDLFSAPEDNQAKQTAQSTENNSATSVVNNSIIDDDDDIPF